MSNANQLANDITTHKWRDTHLTCEGTLMGSVRLTIKGLVLGDRYLYIDAVDALALALARHFGLIEDDKERGVL